MKKNVIRILVACEESQAVTTAFRERGFVAFSADTQKCSGGHPEWHIQGDVLDVLFDDWDCIIAFPPCTYLSRAGSTFLYPTPGKIDIQRYKKGLEAKQFFMQFYNHPTCKHIAIENPVANKIYDLPDYDCIVEPYQFGHAYTKHTRLWLKGLPPLIPTDLILKDCTCSWLSKTSYAKTRAKTFAGIANAMAKQWGDYLIAKTSI